jgi:hypothetical protein
MTSRPVLGENGTMNVIVRSDSPCANAVRGDAPAASSAPAMTTGIAAL